MDSHTHATPHNGVRHAGVGVSSASEASQAVHEAVEQAKQSMDGEQPQVVFVFASSEYDQHRVTEVVAETLPGIPMVGGSTAGEISQAGPSALPSVVVLLLAFESATIASAVVTDANVEPEQKGSDLVAALTQAGTPEEALLVMVSDGLTVNAGALLRGMYSARPRLPVVGGSSGDDGKFKQTFQYSDGKAYCSSAAAVLIGGGVPFSVGVRHGWNPISGPRKVTSVAGGVIKEIDGKPAIALYEEFVGAEKAATLKGSMLAKVAISYPLGIRDKGSGEMLLRAPMYAGDDGSIACGGEVPADAEVLLMMGSKESAVAAAEESARQAMDRLGTEPKAAILFNCHVRNTLYATNEQAGEEIKAIQSVIGTEVPMVGFYTYAEQAPIGFENYNIKTCDNFTHNETIVILLLG